jgi:hypothetical protein
VLSDIGAAGGHLHFLEHVEVVGDRRRPVADMSVISTPSIDHLLLPVAAPREMYMDCCPDWLPPTLERSIVMPGVRSSITHGSRADGLELP